MNKLVEAAQHLLNAVTYSGVSNLPNNAGKGYMARVPTDFVDDLQAALSEHPVEPSSDMVEVMGMKIEDIQRMINWWNNGSPKPFMDFWKEAFDAGVKQAIAAMQKVNQENLNQEQAKRTEQP